MMNQDTSPSSFKLVVYYINGTSQTFEVPIQGWDKVGNAASQLMNMGKADKLFICLKDNRLIGIPYSSVLYFEIDPVPEKVPNNILKDVVLLQED
ncbi:hypothetical protein PN465_11080 [Nodularia spumigena CS-584]|nr:hypothetical protein [Nodularia spumigena]MDB9382759.1 hypothetical protein [Nodularia spumigena CS-584]